MPPIPFCSLQLHTQLFVRRRCIQILSHSRIEDTAELSWAFSRDVDPSVSIRLQWSGAREQGEAQGEEEDNELTAAPRYNLRSRAQSSAESSGDGPVRALCATGDGCNVVEHQPGTLELTPMNKDASMLAVCEREHFLYTLHCIFAEEEGEQTLCVPFILLFCAVTYP